MGLNLRKGVLYAHPIFQLCESITSCVSKLLRQSFLSNKYNDITVLLPNFKVVGTTEADP